MSQRTPPNKLTAATHIQVRVQPIGFADEDCRTDKLLPEDARDAAHQQGKNDGP
jgi:hypothetical protein